MEDNEKKIAELEERLNKATSVYKTQKVELENALKKIAELESNGNTDVTALNERIKELEDEIAINGNSSEEIKTLNSRLDKAKTVFAEQKEKIAELKNLVSEQGEKLETARIEFEKCQNALDERAKAFSDIKAILERFEG